MQNLEFFKLSGKPHMISKAVDNLTEYKKKCYFMTFGSIIPNFCPYTVEQVPGISPSKSCNIYNLGECNS